MDDAEEKLATVNMHTTNINLLEQKISKLNDDVATLKGLVQVQDMELKDCKSKIVTLTARNMQNNVLITGIMGDNTEEKDCKQKVLCFVREKLLMTVEEDDVVVAHRIDKNDGTKPRTMVVRCTQKLRDRIFDYTKNLKDVKNSNGDYYNVKPQLPEPLLSEKICREEQLKAIRKANDLLPEDQMHKKVSAYIKNRTLYINKIPQRQHVQAPSVQDIFNITEEDNEKMKDIKFETSNVIADKASLFRGFATRINNTAQIRLAYRKLKLLYLESNHIMMAYVVKNYLGNDDNGEFGASKKMK